MEYKSESVRLTLDSIKEIIAKDEPEVEITDLEEEPGSGRGDNYTSMLYRLRVMGTKQQQNCSERVKWQRAIIYKVIKYFFSYQLRYNYDTSKETYDHNNNCGFCGLVDLYPKQ